MAMMDCGLRPPFLGSRSSHYQNRTAAGTAKCRFTATICDPTKLCQLRGFRWWMQSPDHQIQGATMTATHFSRLTTFAALGLCLSAIAAAAQPTQAQRDAIRSNCRSDYMANCSSVTPGGAEALQCLQRNMSKLAPACQSAVNAISPPPAAPAAPKPATSVPAPTPAAAPAPPPPAATPATTPAPAPAAAPPARTATNVAPAAAPAPAARPASAPTQQQRDAIRAACQSDFMSRCRGVQPGGAEALQCLQRNSSQLAPACRTAVSAISGGAAASTAAATPAAPAAAAAPAAMPTAAQQNAIKMSCRGDFMANCRGVQPGGQDAFMCLQRNSAKLSPGCKTALNAVVEGDPSGAAPTATAAAAPAARPGLPPGPFPRRRALRERMMGGQ
jgi:hypothetical protein